MRQTSSPIPHFCSNCIFFSPSCLPQRLFHASQWLVALTLVKKGSDGKYTIKVFEQSFWLIIKNFCGYKKA